MGVSGRNRGSAREAAVRVFLDWEAGRETADALLAHHLDRALLRGRERDLATELVLGVFRWRGRLDWQLAQRVSTQHSRLPDCHPR